MSASLRTVVIEVSGDILRSGFAGDHSPRFEVPCSVHQLEYPGVLETFHNLFFSVMLIKPKDINVLLIEDTYLRQSQQNIIATVLLRDLQVGSLSLQSKLHLAIVASGLGNGIIVHLGEEESYTFCFADYRPILHSLRWTKSKSTLDTEHYESSSKKTIDSDEMAMNLLESVKSCNSDLRYSVSCGIVVCGEVSFVPGLSEEICNKATHLLSEDSDYNNLAKLLRKLPHGQLRPTVSPFNPVLLSWVGGSIYASLQCEYQSNQNTFLKITNLNKSDSSDILQLPDWMSLSNTNW